MTDKQIVDLILWALGAAIAIVKTVADAENQDENEDD